MLIMQKVEQYFYNHFYLSISKCLMQSDPKQLMETIVFCMDSILSQIDCIQTIPSIFDIKNKPTISFPNYLMRIFSFMGCSLSAYVYGLILLDKIQEENPGFRLTNKNVYRLLFTSIVIATKFVDDKYYKNKYYATVGGISLQQLNQMEEKMMELLNYHCPANSDLFDSYLERLEKLNMTRIENEQQKTPPATEPFTPATEPASPQPKKRQVRQKRERSREKISDRHYDTQESREIDFY